ncbi:hypothetical protein OW763_15525 [Clostridium aestuarii]|uniref:ABC transporter permease n=1 Tax=Clostridium aestuarii TaxID=338193 RepID=A0ABT4D3A9_9CLOT|nr:hypothetical protein [Clostridium aestuarii]MCY6485734.1 hypothetical protein [Clostridium aestuarii]
MTFTLPVSGNKIVGSKIIVSLMWFAAASVLGIVIFMLILKGDLDLNIISEIRDEVNLFQAIMLGIIVSIVLTVKFLSMVYFSITISKVAFKKKRIGKALSFILFIILNAGISYIEYLVVKYIPYMINIELIRDVQYIGMNIIQRNYGVIQGSAQGVQMNVAGTIYSILILIILFVGIGYLIDNKIDL